ncbi:MAG TPA: MSMEG_0565 family glycosyltransferase [Polyangia bacterium]|nr:MSMEG_0565 family glycosyltransferase [Polyangia bacterium]
MRSVGIFTYSTLPRGSVVHAAALADALADAGWDVTLYALDKDRRGFYRPVRARLRLVPAAPAPATTSELVKLRAAELAAYLDDHDVAHDVHHAQDCLTANGLLAARARGVPVTLVRTVHHVERFESPHLAACQTRSIKEAALCLAVSETARRDVAATFGVDCDVVGNGVDARRFEAVDAARLAAVEARLGRGGPVVLAVGGVEPRKNTLRTLLAFAKLRARHPAARLVIMGGATVLDHGAYRAAFDDALATLPADTRRAVVELGVVPDDEVPAVYRCADVLALPSEQEGFGLAALEAMAAGVPVVASAQPPFTEFLDETCAVLVDPLSVDAVAEGLSRALADAPRLIHGGRARARRHGWDAVAARHLAPYERISVHARDALLRSLA